MFKQKRNINIASAICILIILIMAITGITTACMPSVDKSNILTESEEPVDKEIKDEPVADDTKEELKEPEKKTILIDPVETEERAVEIAKKFNISGADSFRYKEFTDYNFLAFHVVVAEGDINTEYMIYDINGEIMCLYSNTNFNMDDDVINEDEATKKCASIIEHYYGDVELSIDSCILSDRKLFSITGSIYKDIEGSVRPIEIQLDGAGELLSLRAEYDGIYALGISQEIVDKVLIYSKTDSKDIELNQQKEMYGEQQYTFDLDDNHAYVIINASDNSLVRYARRPDDEVELQDYDLSESESKEIGERFLLEYFPNVTDVKYSNFEVHEEKGYLNGELNVDKQPYDFNVAILFDKTLSGVGIDKIQDFDSMDTVPYEQMKETALKIIDDECMFLKGNLEENLVLKNDYLADDENTPHQHIFEFEYHTDNPTAFDCSFIAMAGVNIYTGEFGTSGITPILDDLDMISEQEAIEICKANILEAYPEATESKLKFKEVYIENFIPVEYVAVFVQDEKTYSSGIYVDTGEMDSVGVGW